MIAAGTSLALAHERMPERVCQYETDAVQNSTDPSPFVFSSERQFTDPNLQGAQQMDPEGRTITWSHSTFTCGPEVVDGTNGAEATKESFLDIVKGEWPYIALAGGAHVFFCSFSWRISFSTCDHGLQHVPLHLVVAFVVSRARIGCM